MLGSLYNLRRIDLRGNGLAGKIPAALGNLSNLDVLYLSHNRFSGCVPASLQSVPNSDFDRLDLPFCPSGG